LRLLHSRPITLDPAFQTDLLPLMSDRLLRSTLVAYRHVGGPAGTQVVPDLAVAVPQPSGNATAFAFRLRPGIVYSDGRALVASDFRRGLERVVALQTGNSANFMNIEGAEACARAGDESSDLSAGIDTDDSTGAVVFHLRRPDPDFVARLTEFAAAPVPPATPYRDMALEAIPGTGPYVVANARADQVRYVRNPRFTERSHSAQPDGLADEITLDIEESRAKQTAAVVNGRADWAAYIAMEQLAELRVKIPGRLHPASIPTTDFFQFNLNLPPFDDIRVRQALNLAVDRDHIVKLYGGPDLATPTCQVLPPGIPAYRPHCPFTKVPTDSGAWREPDLERAQQLVAASGTRGTKVTVWGFTDDPTIRPEVVRYVASVLRGLGYDTTVRLESQGSDLPLARIQIISGAWGRDTAHGTLTTWFSCDGARSHGYFCDPQVDTELLRTQAAGATDPRQAQQMWAALDRHVTEQAGWLPMINEGGIELVSDRLGNYQFNPYWGFIADQASVN
jgi:peptide/nickel transport system substrate-binding protein